METYSFNVTIKVDNPYEFVANDNDIGVIIKEGLKRRCPTLLIRAVNCEEVRR